MSEEMGTLGERLAQLKQSFDESFSRRPGQQMEHPVRFALVRAAGKRYGLRVSQLAGLEANRAIVPVPSQLAGLLGLSAVRGQLVPVFELAALLGESAATQAPRWLALYDGLELVGLAFEEFEGARHVAAQELQTLGQEDELSGLSPQALRVEGSLVPVLNLARVVARIGAGAFTEDNQGNKQRQKDQ